jgi:hypothetical protein
LAPVLVVDGNVVGLVEPEQAVDKIRAIMAGGPATATATATAGEADR